MENPKPSAPEAAIQTPELNPEIVTAVARAVEEARNSKGSRMEGVWRLVADDMIRDGSL